MQVVQNNRWAILAGLLAAASLSAGCAGGVAVTTPLQPSHSNTNNTVEGGATTLTTGNGSGGYTSGGGDTSLNLPSSGGGTTAGTGSAYSPAITVPPVEYFTQNSAPGEDDVQAWLENCYETLPQNGSVFQNASLENWAQAIFQATNRARVADGLQPLVYERHLEALAQAHARDMGLRDYFSHDCPDGVLMWDRWLAVKVPYTNWAGENAAMGQESAQEVVDEWTASPGHHRNMFHDTAKYCGVGVYFDAADAGMPVKIIMEYADFRDDPATNNWYEFGDVYR